MLVKSSWWRPLHGDPMGWLLGYDNPAVHYYVLTDLLTRHTDVPAVRDARRNLASNPIAKRLFELHLPDSGWGPTPDAKKATVQATVDHLVLLAELGAPGNDTRIATAADWALEQMQTAEGDYEVPGIFLWALLRFRYDEDLRVRRAVKRAAKYLVARGTPDAPSQRTAWDALPYVWALLQLPDEERSKGVETAIETALAEIERIDWENLPPERLAFGFPHLGEPDMLFALRVLAEARRVTHERVKPGVQVMLQHQNERGRWALLRNHSDRLLVVAEETGPESKWSTLNALRVLAATEIM